ncbi:MAG: hypothetical protein DWQ34_22915 [Planctomycetota bacterium]|nr:MAG: hypothetical protein DWQ34_22915 [Planctomycetota bacterium]REJ88232.1 MAG: hypothetical protein DWQ29_08655 [Planctomycetota bacterium]REK24502.1 MAG: hypothetical protein DWQ41_15950 [Planctomycetota bacterium]REK32463.1 MAG: hypothetical protein DWQ45_17085 [Planctomycetota bacterium]
MSETPARFEFRAFAQSFGRVVDSMRGDRICSQISESAETYLLSRPMQGHNIKHRDGRIEVKRLLDRTDRLERWAPAAEASFPVAREFLESEVLPALGAAGFELSRASYSSDQILEEIVGASRDLWQARVFKRRFRFTAGRCLSEFDEVLVNGAAIQSVAVESAEKQDVLAMLDRLGLTDYENVNYPCVIRRIMGLEPWPREAKHAAGD